MAIDYDKSSEDWFNRAENDDAINEQAFNKFLFWEAATHDTIDFKKVYVDVAGDLNAGLALSEIVYWYLPSKKKQSRLRVKKEGKHWVACQRHEWWERTRMSPKQIDRALAILEKRGLIEKKRFRFNGEVTVHVRLIHNTFMAQLNEILVSPPENPFLPKGKTDFDQRVKSELPKGEIPLTESTTETTASSISTDVDSTVINLGDTETQPPKAKRARKPEPIFDTLAELHWNIHGTADVDKTTAIRINKIKKWLKENSPGATAETLRAFVTWFCEETEGKASPPRDVAKFAERFVEFREYRQRQTQTPAPTPIVKVIDLYAELEGAS